MGLGSAGPFSYQVRLFEPIPYILPYAFIFNKIQIRLCSFLLQISEHFT